MSCGFPYQDCSCGMHEGYVPEMKIDPDAPPRRLSNDATHRDFHISFMRVGLRIDDKERDDVCWYDADALRYRVVGSKVEQPALSIEPYWRYPESRQNRRQRERWEASHK